MLLRHISRRQIASNAGAEVNNPSAALPTQLAVGAAARLPPAACRRSVCDSQAAATTLQASSSDLDPLEEEVHELERRQTVLYDVDAAKAKFLQRCGFCGPGAAGHALLRPGLPCGMVQG